MALLLLKGSWDLVIRVIIRVTILITSIKVLITLLTKSHDPLSKDYDPTYHGELKVNLFIIQGLCKDYTTPKRLKVTYSTSK